MTGKSYCPARLAFDNRDWDTLARLMRELEADKARLDHLEEERKREGQKGRWWGSFHFDTECNSDLTVRQQLDKQRGAA